MAAWGYEILSSRAESISHSFASLTRERYFQHFKIKFVSPRSHEISSIKFSCIKYKFKGTLSHCNGKILNHQMPPNIYNLQSHVVR